MTEINNEISGQQDQMDNGSEGNERSEQRHQDLANKVRDLAKKNEDDAKQHEAEKNQLLQEKKDLEFKANFLDASSRYPNAREFEADIKAKVSSGYTVQDAIVSTLAAKGKFETVPPSKTGAMGGSADTPISERNRQDPSFGGDIAKMREEIIRLEKTGEIGLKF